MMAKLAGGKRIIIYTDLDGLLLDHTTRSFTESLPALSAAQAKGVPIVFCSSKTQAEIELLRQNLQVSDPFIVENGAAAIIPSRYFPYSSRDRPSLNDARIVLGVSYRMLAGKLHELRKSFPGKILGFSDMTAEEISRDSGLPIDQARMAKQREYDEPFRLVDADAETISRLMEAIRRLGLSCSPGRRYYHLHGDNDRATAVRILNRFLWEIKSETFTIGLGNSLCDLTMLSTVNYPVLVKKPDGTYDEQIIKHLPRVHLTTGAGPAGWREAILGILKGV